MSTHFAVLPEGLLHSLSAQLSSDGHQFLSLPHPRTGFFSLFVPTESEILEVQAVTPTNPRSWILDQEVVEDGKLLVMTPIDSAFLLIPLMESANSTIFRTADDIFEQLSLSTKAPTADNEATASRTHQSKGIASLASLQCTQVGLRRVCEVKDISTDTTVYRYSQEKAIQYLKRKVDRLSSSNNLEQSKTITRILARDGLMEDGKEALLTQGRIKAACDLVGQYLSPKMKSTLLSTYDLKALDKHLQSLREEETPLKSTTNTVKGKTAAGSKVDDGKKRKAAKGSHGVEQLKKANTTGMAKLSSFFTKVAK